VDIVRRALDDISVERMRDHIAALEGVRHRETGREALARADAYIWDALASLGYEMTAHHFGYDGRQYRNVIGTHPGARQLEGRAIVLAHYDTVSVTPGADDNASGIAAVLEIARVLRPLRFDRPVQFVAVNLEEVQEGDASDHPSLLGSQALADHARANDWQIEGVVVFDTIAYAGASVEQTVPAGLPIEVPKTGDFVVAVANEVSAALAQGYVTAIERYEIPLPCLPLVVPGDGEVLPDTRRSDHAPFWDAGYRALFVTDTANFRNPHYHRPGDTLETLNLPFLVQVSRAAGGLAAELAGCNNA
jgi:Zn-dependent M28 family amino/carboxypeptidase